MIIVITTQETNPKTGRKESIASHGIDADTGKSVILPNELPGLLGATFDNDIGEWVIK